MVREKMDYRDVANGLIETLQERGYYIGDSQGRNTGKPEFDNNKAVMRIYEPIGPEIKFLWWSFQPRTHVGTLQLMKQGIGFIDVYSNKDFPKLRSLANSIGRSSGYEITTWHANPVVIQEDSQQDLERAVM